MVMMPLGSGTGQNGFRIALHVHDPKLSINEHEDLRFSAFSEE